MASDSSNIGIRSSMLVSYELCPRMFAANWLKENKMDGAALGLAGRKPPAQNVGAVVGTASHEGHAYLMNAIQATGELGGLERLTNAVDVAHSKLKELWEAEAVSTDPTTPTQSAAFLATEKITRQMFHDVEPGIEPLLVEKGMQASYRYREGGETYRMTITGTIDAYMLGRRLPDVKTGRNKPMPITQLGTYAALLDVNGYPVETLEAHYWKRVGKNAQQPGREVIPINLKAAKSHARSVAKSAHMDLLNMMRNGSAQHMAARPHNFLCDPRFCPAFGTKFCTIGQEFHPNRREKA